MTKYQTIKLGLVGVVLGGVIMMGSMWGGSYIYHVVAVDGNEWMKNPAGSTGALGFILGMSLTICCGCLIGHKCTEHIGL